MRTLEEPKDGPKLSLMTLFRLLVTDDLDHAQPFRSCPMKVLLPWRCVAHGAEL